MVEISKTKEYDLVQVETSIRNIELIEKFLDVDEYDDSSDNSLVRMEMNVIEFPMFSKNPKVKKNQALKYYFSKDKQSYLEITPPNNEAIPNELDERVFIALLKVMKKNGNSPIFYCSLTDIIDGLNVNGKARKAMYSRIQPSVVKLSKTNYAFFNLFYKSSLRSKVDDLISTSLLSIRIITFKDADDKEKNFFKDRRVKEVYRIRIADDIYDNITNKGYLVFDADVLLSIKDSVVRSLYTQITKWRFNQLYLKRPIYYIAQKIPLSWEGSMVFKSTQKIIDSFEELKRLCLITDFKYLKGKKVENSEIEVFFSSEHNKFKQQLFYQDKDTYNDFIHSIEKKTPSEISFDYTDLEMQNIISTFGPKGTTLKTLPHVIKEALSKYEFEYVKYTAEYTSFNAKASLLKYFKDALLNNWADEYIAKKKAKENKIATKKIEIIEEAYIVENPDSKTLNLSWGDFEKLPIESQNKIKDKAYKIYLEETNSSDNNSSKNIFEKTQKALIVKIYNQEKEEPSVIAELEENTSNKKTYPSLANFSMNFYKLVKKTNLEITLVDIISSLQLLGEYDDNVFYATYDLEKNTGYYELKK